MSLLILDNYDSFTYNLVELVRQCNYSDFRVVPNDKINIHEAAGFDMILVSPGPGVPAEAGFTHQVIRELAPEKKILGVCLGHQAIAEVFGGSLFQLDSVCHGLQTSVHITDRCEPLFKGLEITFHAGLYHSWAVSNHHLPDTLTVTARSGEGVIMGIRHKTFNVKGIQFHPESVMTPNGRTIINNWLRL